MEFLKEGTPVKYTGKTNNYTFKDDLSTNSIGIIKRVSEVDGITCYQVEFENGISTTIDLNDLEKLK